MTISATDRIELERIWCSMSKRERDAFRDKAHFDGIAPLQAISKYPELIPERLRKQEGAK